MLTLLLVGRSGNGRSSVGNTILGDRNAFKVIGSSEAMRKQKNAEFVVVDCMGIGDTGFESGADIWSAICVDTVDAREIDQSDNLISTDVASGTCQHLTLCGDDEDGTGPMESFVYVEEHFTRQKSADSAVKESEIRTTEQNDGEDIEVSKAIVTEVPLFHLTQFWDDEDGTGPMESFVYVEDPFTRLKLADSAVKESEILTTEQNDGENFQVSNAIVTEVPVFHALIFVMKYGVRFTKQERDAVQMVKSVFGDNVFKDLGILVFSYGDNFYQDSEDDGIEFERWCGEQTGDIRSLFQEVDYRCVIFDNKTRVEAKQDEQRQKLKECIKLVGEKKDNPYTLTQFKQAEFSRIKEKEFKPLQRETEHFLRKANEKTGTGEDVVDWVVELKVHLGDYLLLLNKLDYIGNRNGAVAQMRRQLHDQINTLEAFLANKKSREFQVNILSLQMLDNVKNQIIHLAVNIVSFLNLGFNIKEYFKSFTT